MFKVALGNLDHPFRVEFGTSGILGSIEGISGRTSSPCETVIPLRDLCGNKCHAELVALLASYVSLLLRPTATPVLRLQLSTWPKGRGAGCEPRGCFPEQYENIEGGPPLDWQSPPAARCQPSRPRESWRRCYCQQSKAGLSSRHGQI